MARETPHVDAGIEQLLGQPRHPALVNHVEARAGPVAEPIDRLGGLKREVPHRPFVTVGPGRLLGDAELGRAAAVGGVIDVTALAGDQVVEHTLDVGRRWHALLLGQMR